MANKKSFLRTNGESFFLLQLIFITSAQKIIMGLFSRFQKDSLDKGLAKTKESVIKKLSRAVVGKSTVDDEVLDNLEEVLITSDVGVETTLKIIDRIQERVRANKYLNTTELNSILKEENYCFTNRKPFGGH